MSNSRLSRCALLVFVILLAAASVRAQDALAPQPPPADPVIAAPAEAQTDRELFVFRSEASTASRSGQRRIAADSVVDGTHGTVTLDGSAGWGSYGVGITADPQWPHVGVKLGGSTWNDRLTVFNSSSSPLLTIRGDGRVGVGTDPSWRLHSYSATDGIGALWAHTNTTVEANTEQVDYGAYLFGYQTVNAGVNNTGSVYGGRVIGFQTGPGSLATSYGLYVQTGLAGTTGTGAITYSYGTRIKVAKSYGTIAAGYGLFIDDVDATVGYGIWQWGADDKNYFAGSVGIGIVPAAKLHVSGDVKGTGNAHFDGTVTGGNIKAKYQDVAEWVPATGDLAPGTVVVLNPAKSNEVMPSGRPYDTMVAGVVSAQPGLVLGEESAGSEQIATTGRVKVRVDARRGSVRIGDLLVTSDMPGAAMRSEPMEINGRRFHQPGTIIGKALEPLESGVGEILVLLSMQ